MSKKFKFIDTTKIEPVYKGLFEVRFRCKDLTLDEAKTLTDLTAKIKVKGGFDSDFFGGFTVSTPNRLTLEFDQAVIDGAVEPITTFERLFKQQKEELSSASADPEDTGFYMDVILNIHDKKGNILRKHEYLVCNIVSIKGLTSFDYSDIEVVDRLELILSYKDVKISNSK